MRRSVTAGGVTTDFVLDGQDVIQELRNGTVHATYLTGPRGVECRQDASGQVRWYLYDGLGSVIAELGEPDQNNNPVKCTRKYDVYGAVRGSSGDSDSNHKFVGGPGHTSEDETGLIYMRARYYDPVIGRFISEDPAGDGLNWYGYCDNNPVNAVDSDGRYSALTASSTFWYALGTACTILALLQAAAYPKVGKWTKAVSKSISRLSNIALGAFGLAAVGQDIPIWAQMTTGFGALVSLLVSEVIATSARGMRTAAAAAVGAAALYSVLLAGTILGDYTYEITNL